ncbi:MAG TPA: TerC/Alx family metal homeostasis membrane protein [Bacteroidales bacterium]|nr:TerC/Alx family metal homeostasis membrane protein [Bacteroidales bacterium]HPT11600.1 TerC/Alx family metal homeostasis membrane protein [Bacteroidales bacterium]
MMGFLSHNIFFIVFGVVILGVLMIDLLLVGKDKHEISLKESLIWTSIWVTLAVGFCMFIRFYGHHIHNITDWESLKSYVAMYQPTLRLPLDNYDAALDAYRKTAATDFITGYLLEYTLSLDNVFVIMLLLTGFGVNKSDYKQVLFWGILGAIVLRFIFIFVGSALISRFNWILLVFGAFLLYSGIHMFITRNKQEDTADSQGHWLVKFLSKHFNVYPTFIGHYFWKRVEGKFYITPLLVVLLMVELTDVIFAMDSIPAIFSITLDPYIVFFSNIFAIIGLRSLFFLLVKVVDLFHYLKVGIAFLLSFIGFKLLFHHWLDTIGYKNVFSLYIIGATLLISILASLAFPEKKEKVVKES